MNPHDGPRTLTGDLGVAAPVGFVKVGDRLEKDPDRRARETIRLAVDKIAELGCVRQALLWFFSSSRPGWMADRSSSGVHVAPSVPPVIANPACGGACACGLDGVSDQYGAADPKATQRRAAAGRVRIRRYER